MYDFIQIDAKRFEGKSCPPCRMLIHLRSLNGFEVLPGVTINNSSCLSEQHQKDIKRMLEKRGKQVALR